MNTEPAIIVSGLSHYYGDRCALNNVSFNVERGEIFAFLGPNGGGKTTLFRVLSTLVPPQSDGNVAILGNSVRTNVGQVRSVLGVVFQAPSVDRKLTVQENLYHQAALYGIPKAVYAERRDQLLDQMGLSDRRNDYVETLSGGLRRRVELAKGMIHHPQVLLMDEPSTGLDPGARSDLWVYLRKLRDESSVTILMTTHLLEEAEKADRIAIINEGSIVALDEPATLCAELGGDVITIKSPESSRLASGIKSEFGVDAAQVDSTLRLELENGHDWIQKLVAAFPDDIESIRLGRPTLEDVFIARTGHQFWTGDA